MVLQLTHQPTTPPMTDTKTARAFDQAQAQLDEIQRMSDLLDSDADNDDLQEELWGLAISQEVRSGWRTLGQDLEADMYRLVLCTGGPHVEIVGSLGAHGDPDSAVLYCQDWYTAKEEVTLSEPEQELLLWFAQSFYWGN
jgi:hypothetical protein